MKQPPMKSKSYTSPAPSMLLLVLLLTLLVGCAETNHDPEPSVQDKTRSKMIANHWIIQAVKVDGVDRSLIYNGLTIRFGESSFETTNGGEVWPTSGLWQFTTADATIIKRNDGIEIQVEVTEAMLRLTLQWAKTTYAGGRQNSVKGTNIFTFVKTP